MKIRLAPVNRLEDLEKLVKKYKNWNIWTYSKECFLSPTEVQVINLYLKTHSYAACAELLQISIMQAASIISNAVFSLKVNYAKYQRWHNHSIPSLYKRVARTKTIIIS